MPRRMWAVDFKCPQCRTESLKLKGIYNRIRSVVDLKDMYWMVTKYMYCPKCGVTIQSSDDQLLNQLTSDVRAWFPTILTQKYACDVYGHTLLGKNTGKQLHGPNQQPA